jgi:hypothetical protein
MRHIFLVAAGDVLICLVGCVSPRQTAISEAVGPAPTKHSPLPGESALQVYSARVKAPVDLNEDEFMQNNGRRRQHQKANAQSRRAPAGQFRKFGSSTPAWLCPGFHRLQPAGCSRSPVVSV